jgi:protein-L-isoaspartate O-methyltransferase
MRVLRQAAKDLFRLGFKLNAQNAISQLHSNLNEVSKALGTALRETLQNNLTLEEKVWIDKIEFLREELNSSATEISIVDFGAGKPKLGLTNEDMYRGRVVYRSIGEVCRGASKPYFWSLLLFKLIRKFKPSFCLELGTCLGISTSFQAAALNLNGMGEIVTLEGADSLASLAEGHFAALGLDNVSVVIGRFQDTLNDVLNVNRSVDFVFVDGHHDEKATIQYFEQLKPFV